MKRVETALISVSDKTDLVEFGAGLADLGIEIYSTSRTHRLLQRRLNGADIRYAGSQDKLPELVQKGVNRNGKRVGRNKTRQLQAGALLKKVSDYTDHKEALNGRLKTLNWRLLEAILTEERQVAQRNLFRNGNGSPVLDMVVVNFYPFEDAVADPAVGEGEAIENVDVGGPTMVRSAAKNFRHVIVVVDPEDYPDVLSRLRNGGNTIGWRRHLALKAWRMVADYDEAIAGFFEGRWTKTVRSRTK